jgi:thymidylate kinase
MPLIVICGHPCSGKSTVARQVVEACRRAGHEAALVDEESLHLTRDASYRGEYHIGTESIAVECFIFASFLRPTAWPPAPCQLPRHSRFTPAAAGKY